MSLVFRRKDLCEAKQNVECSKKRSKYYALLMCDYAFRGGQGGLKYSVLNMNAIVRAKCSKHECYSESKA